LNQSLQSTLLINEIRCQPGIARDPSKIKLGNEALQRGGGIQFAKAEHRGITNLPAENVHGATVPWLSQAGRVLSMTQLA